MKKTILLVLAAALLLLSGCRAVKPVPLDPPGERTWTPADYTTTFGDADPWEGFNRSMFAVNEFGMLYVVRPIGWIYGSILPRPVIKGINNVSENLTFPAKLFACLLQAKWHGAGVETLRFLTNSTIGIAGIFDPADHYFDLFPYDEDFGQVFETWGIGSGYTLILPLCSATNVRDTVGAIFDAALDIKMYLPYGASTFANVNRLVNGYRPFVRLTKANADPYEVYKEYSLLNRQLRQRDWPRMMRIAGAKMKKNPPAIESDPAVTRPPGIDGRIIVLRNYRPEGAYPDTVRITMFGPQSDDTSFWTQLSLWNTDFTEKAHEMEVAALRPDAKPLDYYFWHSPDPAKRNSAPLAIILPGVGAHHTSVSAVALAEVLNYQGYAVIVLPSVFSFSYYLSMLDAPLPGYTPRDAESLRQTIKRILADLAGNASEKKRFTPESVNLVGLSLGALDALHIAAAEERKNTLKVDRYVAINPPVDLVYALEQFDKASRVMKGTPRDEIEIPLSEAFGKAMGASARRAPFREPPAVRPGLGLDEYPVNNEFDYRTGLSEKQAAYLASMTFRYTIRDVMMVACRDNRLPFASALSYGWSNRTNFYRDVDRIPIRSYMTDYLLSSLRKPDGNAFTVEELRAATGLRAVEATLRNNEKVRVLHTLDDFLVSDTDRRFLDSALGKRITWFTHGSHLGNLYYGHLHQVLLNELGK